MKKIVIDAGHGGRDVGAVGPTGLTEAMVNLDIALRIAQLLDDDGFDVENGLEVLGTRLRDEFIELADRAAKANACDADLFVSIHCNASTNRDANGFEVWTTPGHTESDAIAEAVIESIASAFSDAKLRADLQDGDRDREENFLVLRKTSCPAILVETGFISHVATESAMRTPLWRTRMAMAIAAGIRNGLRA